MSAAAGRVFAAALLFAGWSAVPLLGRQTAITAADVARLDAAADDAARLIAALGPASAAAATDLDRQLTGLREDITYLKVKLRRDGVSAADYADVRDRLDALRAKARGAGPTAPAARLPAGAKLDVRLRAGVNSGSAKEDDRFDARTILDAKSGDVIAVPAGSAVTGFVSSVRPSGRPDRSGSLTLSFEDLAIGDEHWRLRASVDQVLDGHVSGDFDRAEVNAAMGSGLAGTGAALRSLSGLLVLSGGTITSTEGANLDLPTGTILRIRLDLPLTLKATGDRRQGDRRQGDRHQ